MFGMDMLLDSMGINAGDIKAQVASIVANAQEMRDGIARIEANQLEILALLRQSENGTTAPDVTPVIITETEQNG